MNRPQSAPKVTMAPNTAPLADWRSGWPDTARTGLRIFAQCPVQCIRDGIDYKDPPLINNRQAGRRNNRGRDNRRPTGGNRGGGDNGNRIDNRARGNAPQLLEKYKNLARDAQLAGDRVNAEYYLQFADHYFRVIADNRQRQEEMQARYRRTEENFDEESEGEGRFETAADFATGSEAMEGEPASEQGFEPRNRRDGFRNRQDRRPRNADDAGAPGNEAEQADQPVAAQDSEERGPSRSRRGDRTRTPRRTEDRNPAEESSLDLAVLPPAISRPDNDVAPETEEAAPARKRTRKPRQTEAEAAE